MIAVTTELRDFCLEPRPIDLELAHGGLGRDLQPLAIFIALPALFQIPHDFIGLVGLITHGLLAVAPRRADVLCGSWLSPPRLHGCASVQPQAGASALRPGERASACGVRPWV